MNPKTIDRPSASPTMPAPTTDVAPHHHDDADDGHAIHRLPTVIIIDILSYLPLYIGSSHESRESFISVSHQWYTFARSIPRPVIAWTDEDDSPGDDTVCKGVPSLLIIRKYPNARDAIALMNIPLSALPILIGCYASPSMIASLRSLSCYYDTFDQQVLSIVFDQLCSENDHGTLRSLSFTNDKHPQYVLMATLFHRLLHPYNERIVQCLDDDVNAGSDLPIAMMGTRRAKGLIPIISLNGAPPVICSECKQWSWSCITCGVCHQSWTVCCHSDHYLTHCGLCCRSVCDDSCWMGCTKCTKECCNNCFGNGVCRGKDCTAPLCVGHADNAGDVPRTSSSWMTHIGYCSSYCYQNPS